MDHVECKRHGSLQSLLWGIFRIAVCKKFFTRTRHASPELPYRHIQGVSIGIETTNYAELLEKAKQADILHGEPQLLGGKLECFFVLDPDGMGIQLIKNW